MTTYHFPTFKLLYEPDSDKVTTVYSDGTTCPVHTNKDHAFHAEKLDMIPIEYNLLHELAHHVIAQAMDYDTCPIVWATAHNKTMPENAKELEWMITAISYFMFKVPMRHAHEWNAIREIAEFAEPYELANKLSLLFTGTGIDNINITNE